MVLAEPVLNRQGQVLLGRSAQLEDRHKRVLKTWGVRQVLIEGEGGQEEEPESELTDEMLRLAMNHLDKRWQWEPRNQIEKEVYMVALKRTALTRLRNG